MKDDYEEKVCVQCREIFLRRKKARNRGGGKVGIRPTNSITCSKQCSRLWNNGNKRQREYQKEWRKKNKLIL